MHAFIKIIIFCIMINLIATTLVIIGGLNWGLVGITNFLSSPFNLVEYIFTQILGVPIITDIIYVLIGVSAIIASFTMMNK